MEKLFHIYEQMMQKFLGKIWQLEEGNKTLPKEVEEANKQEDKAHIGD